MPYETEQFRYELVMWMLDQVRCRMPRCLRGAGLTGDIYRIEAKISEAWKASNR